jgi:hypothetical protein
VRRGSSRAITASFQSPVDYAEAFGDGYINKARSSDQANRWP